MRQGVRQQDPTGDGKKANGGRSSRMKLLLSNPEARNHWCNVYTCIPWFLLLAFYCIKSLLYSLDPFTTDFYLASGLLSLFIVVVSI